MSSETDEIPPVNRPVPVAEIQAIRLTAIEIAAHVSLARAIETASAGLAVLLNAPVALLSRDQLAWRFESYAFPGPSSANALMQFRAETTSDPFEPLRDESGQAWTAIGLGRLGAREWALLLPGQSTAWAGSAEFEQLIEQVSRS